MGSVSGGATQTTDNFGNQPIPLGETKVIPNPSNPYREPLIGPVDESTLPHYVYIEDPNAVENPQGGNGQTVLLQKFPGVPMTNYIPPDCIMAVGPSHIITCVNSQFTIWDKEGNPLKIIPANTWWAPAWPDEAGDPQVIYDHFAGRWVLVWMQVNDAVLTAGNLIAYSDDENPLGSWYMYRLDTKLHGDSTNSSTWGDYPQLGFDDEALYVATRCFSFTGGFNYSKIRIINKAELYASNGGPLTYIDFWNIRISENPGSLAPDVIHPTYCYTPGQGGYFFWANRFGGNYYAVYKVTNPLSEQPGLRRDSIPVQVYFNTPNANQLGGGALGIESNGSHCKTAPVIRDGKMYIAHSIGNSTSPSYASAKYVIYDLVANSITEQAELGAVGYYYIYPTITIDKDHNIAVTFSRSALTEYIGGYYSTKRADEPPGLSPSQPLAAGLGNYVLDYGSGRNRWGDYLGIYLDPANEYDVWIFPEYAAGTNIWGTYIGKIRMVPFQGIYSYLSSDSLDFGDVEINTVSDTLRLIISNYGEDDLVITNIGDIVGPFTRISNHVIPLTLSTYDSVIVELVFGPDDINDYDVILPITTNDSTFAEIHLTGHSYEMLEGYTDLFYASTGAGGNGDILILNRETGEGTIVGSSLYNEVKSLTVNPSNNIIYGLVSTGGPSEIVRVNAGQGDSYRLFNLDLTSLTGIAFDTSGSLYVSQDSGKIYNVDLSDGSYTLISTATVPLNAIAFHPITNQLWGAIRKTFGAGKDSVYTIDLQTGETTPIGKTGLNVMTEDMAFDELEKLYGITGASNQQGKLFEINMVDGTGLLIGEAGFNHTIGLAYSINGSVLSVGSNETVIPKEYSLMQNYPNPFNPSTTFEFSLPYASNVKLTVYNILGEVVNVLVNNQLAAGVHSVNWNSTNRAGNKLGSGVYFFELKANGTNGKEFSDMKKMILLK
jgi:hypothetical protein